MADPEHIYNWLRLDENITTSGQPTEDELVELKNLGVSDVINLALHSHEKSLPDEAASLEKLGINYIHIPVAFDAPTESDFNQFCAAITELQGKQVHVHCIVNARVSAFFYRYRREKSSMGEKSARADMHKIWNPSEWGDKGKPWAAFIAEKKL